MSNSKLDRAAEREAARVAHAVAGGESKGMSESKVQDHISIITEAQGDMVNITYAKGSRTCSDSTRKVTLITPEPLVDGVVTFMEIRDGGYSSTAKVNDGFEFYVNTFYILGSRFQCNGQMIKFIPRAIQVHAGVWIRFMKTNNKLMDTFTIYFYQKEEVTLGTQCGKIQEGIVLKNGTTLAIPVQCTVIADGIMYMRAVDIQKEAKEELGQDMLHREALNPAFTVLVHKNNVELSLNETLKE